MTKKRKYFGFLSDRQFQIVVGCCLMLFLAFSSVSMVSYLFNSEDDNKRLEKYEGLVIKLKTANGNEIAYIKTQMKKIKSGNGNSNNDKIEKIENMCGYAGAVIGRKFINEWAGLGAFFMLAFGFALAIKLIGLDRIDKTPIYKIKIKRIKIWKSFLLLSFLTLWVSVFCAFVFDNIVANSTALKYGGEFGISARNFLDENTNFGTVLVIFGSAFIFLIIAFSSTIPFMKKILVKSSETDFNKKPKFSFRKKKNNGDEKSVKIGDEIVPEEWVDFKIDNDKKTPKKTGEIIIEDAQNEEEVIEPVPETDFEREEKKTVENVENLPPYDPRADLSHYQFPEISLLKQYPTQNIAEEDKTEREKKIVETLKTFGIGIKQIFRTIGPTITLYEIVPAEGVRINKIRNLADDIMMSLAAIGIRIIAPIPGKGTIGIEVPNITPKIVSMFDTIASKKFQESAYELPVALGRTITNEVFMFDLCKMPHLLVAGATGQGKSVGLNAIITSLLYKKHPAELKFVLIDPKKVEFNIYADIERHFLAKLADTEEPVITDVEKVKKTLNSLCKEMDSRYDLLKLAHARNIKEYNEKFISRHLNPEKGHRFLPYIVVIVDEFGDLIMTAGKEVEMPIARIAQLARAVGMHMIIATQRPSVNIITGVIKANFPARIAFKVSSGVDSKTILDGSGAQQLIGRGDMLFSQGNEPTRVQCAFVDTPEVERIVHFIGDQTGYPTAFELPEPDAPESGGDFSGGIDMSKRDSLFDEAARLIVRTGVASASNIQRKLEVGFARAARIIDQLEAAGIVSGADGSKPRQILVQTEYDLEKILGN
ncbi:MAG: DNA translocase FtsK [Prevotellaceae bacterium]|jgi:S-DNA-T family DNA segregation ATPase FtsK/SpoIIIE|nr:DNA translocase FtsK [Prevotellaceae bacterium]